MIVQFIYPSTEFVNETNRTKVRIIEIFLPLFLKWCVSRRAKQAIKIIVVCERSLEDKAFKVMTNNSWKNNYVQTYILLKWLRAGSPTSWNN